MANGGRIDYTIGFNIDKSGLNDFKRQLSQIQKITTEDFMKINPTLNTKQATKELIEIKNVANEVGAAYQKAFNFTTGVVNAEKLKVALQSIGVEKVASSFSKLGAIGVQSFNSLNKQLLTTNLRFKETNSWIQKAGVSLANVFKWNISSSIINRFTGTISSAIGFVKHLDDSLNDIRIVTGKSADEMDRFAVKANKTAQELGKATTDYTEAALIYYQQGLGNDETAARTETTLKAANVTGQSTAAVSEELTAVWNGYKVGAEETEAAIDKLAAVAATTASDLQELSTGMSKVASAANAMGVDMDQLNAQIATIISVTRQAPESVGTALKTIYARLADLKLGDTDEDGLGLGDVSGTLDKVGIAVLDANGDLREMGDVIEDVAAKWNTWTAAQQTAIAQVMAGKRQYNNLVALFENWDMYSSALDTSRNSLGTLQKQQDIYMESTAAHLQQLKAASEELYGSLLDADTVTNFSDAIKFIVEQLTNFVKAIGGGQGALLGLGAVLTKVFNVQIATSLTNTIEKAQNLKYNLELIQNEINQTRTDAIAKGWTEATDKAIELKNQIVQYYSVMSQEEINTSQEKIRNIMDLYEQVDLLKLKYEEVNKVHQDEIAALRQEATAVEHLIGDLAAAQMSKSGQRGLVGSGGKAAQEVNISEGKNIDAGNTTLEYTSKILDETKVKYESLIKIADEYTEKIKQRNTLEAKANNVNNSDAVRQKAGEQAKKLQQQIDKLTPKLQKAKDELNELFEKGNIDNKVQKRLEELIKSLEEFNKKIKKTANNTSSVSKKFKNEFSQGLEQAKNEIKETQEQLNSLGSTIQESEEKAKAATDEIIAKEEEARRAAEELENAYRRQFLELDTRTLVSGLTSIVSGITTVGFALSSVKGLVQTLTDDSVSGLDKILQVMMSIGMILPGIVTLFKGAANATLVFKTATELSNVAAGKSILIDGVAIKTKTVLEALEWSETKARQKHIVIAEGEAIAVNTETQSELANTAARLENLDALKAQGVAVSGFTKQLAIAFNTIKGMLGPIAAITAAIGVAAFVIKKVNAAHEAEQAALRATNDEIIKNIDAREEERQAIQEEIKSLDQLVDKYNKATYSKQEFLKQSIAEGLDSEAKAALNAAETYEQMIKAIDEYKKRTAEQNIAEQEEKRAAGIKNSFAEQKHWELNEDNELTYDFAQDVAYNENFQKQITDLLGDRAEFSTIQVGNKEKYKMSFKIDVENPEELDNLLSIIENTNSPKQLKTSAQDAIESEAYQSVKEANDAIKQQTLDAAKADVNFDLQFAKSLNDVKAAEEEFVKILGNNYNSKEKLDLFEQYVAGYDNDFVEQYIQQRANRNSITSGYLSSVNPNIDTSSWELKNADEILDAIELEDKDLLNYIGGVPQEFWIEYMTGSLNEEAIQKIIERVKAAREEALTASEESIFEKLPETNSGLNQAIADSIAGELDITSESFQTLKDNLQQIGKTYTEYADDIQVFTNAGLVGTEQWTQAAYRLQDALDNLEIKELNEKVKGLTEELEGIDVEVNADELTDKLQEIMDADYEISVKIHSDAEEDFLNTKAALEQVDNLAGKIGEDFIVAADDIRELNNVFPGILQGMTYMADGTIQLNEEVARSAMAMANDEALSSVEATRTKLENDAKALRSKADTYDAMAQIAYRQISNEEDLEKAKTDLVAELENLEVENDAIATDTELQNAATIANDSQEKAGIMAGNWQEAYQIAAQAANDYGQVAAEAYNAALTGEPPTYQGNYGIAFSGRSTNASEAKRVNVNKVNNVSSASDLQKLGDQYTDMATSLRAQANDIEGMIATLGAKAINTAAKTGGVGAKSGSGSGGGSSEKEAKHEEYLEREEDIYREINEQLDQIESTLGRIQKINDHEWGYDAQVTLEKENKLLEEQLEKLQKKKELQVGDLSYRRKQLEDVGISFSDDGSSMSNAEAVLNALYAHYNQMVDVYNAMSAAEQETYKAELDAEKERIDIIDNKISDYESLYSEYQSTLDDILDKHFEQIENTVSQFNNMVEVHLELDDAKKEWTDFWYDVVKDVEENNFAEQIAKSMSKLGVLVGVGLKDASGSQVAELTRHTAETVAEVSKQIQSAGSGGNLSIFGDDSKLAYETLKDYRDKLMSALEDAEKEVDRVGEVYLQILDDAQDKIDKQVESWNAIGDQLQNNIDLITLVSGDDSYAALAKQFELQYNNNLELVETQRRSKEYWQQEIDKYKSLLASTKEGSKEWKTYSAALEKSTENFKNAVKDLGDTVQKSIEELYKWKKSQIAELEDAFDKGLSNGMGLSDLEDEWSLINESADRYFDQVERSLAMEDINLTFDKLLNNTSLTAEAQKELNKLRDEEISRLEEKDKLNQFDIDELKARLEITKQQMALEDAQRAKTNLRLRRDSQGNYSYQYTADESQIANQAEGLLSAKKDWYELVKKRQLDLYNSALDIRKRLSEKYKELNETDWTNNLEGRQRLLEEIKKLEQLEVDIMRDAEDAKQLFFKGTADYFKEVEDAGMFPQWQSTLMKMGLAWNDGGSDSFIGTVNSGISQSEQLVLDFGDRVNEILTRAGIDYANLRDNGIDPTIDALDDLTDSNEELAESLDETNALLDQQAINLKQVEEAYNALKTAAVEAVESANKVLEELSKTAIETQQQVQASVQAAQNAAAAASRSTSYNRTTGTGTGSTGGGPSSGVNKTDNVLFSAQGYDGKGHSATSAPANARNTRSWIMSAKSTWPSGSVFKVDSTGKRIANVGGWSTRSNGQKIENLTELLKYITTYRSGGYTGTWGGSSGLDDVRSGRLAVLHEKELVLNKDDTKNLLDAVSVLRGISISQVAEGIIAASRAASTAINGVGAGLMQTIAGLTQNVQSGDTNTYSRNMTVNADFSGVKSAEAIYQALMELDNYGMQNAYSNAPHMNRAY